MNEDAIIGDIYNLTDEDGQEESFKLIGKCEYNGKTYFAFQSMDEESEEFAILRVREVIDGEAVLDTIDDDEEFDAVADIFEDEIFFDIDYDENDEDEDGESD